MEADHDNPLAKIDAQKLLSLLISCLPKTSVRISHEDSALARELLGAAVPFAVWQRDFADVRLDVPAIWQALSLPTLVTMSPEKWRGLPGDILALRTAYLEKLTGVEDGDTVSSTEETLARHARVEKLIVFYMGTIFHLISDKAQRAEIERRFGPTPDIAKAPSPEQMASKPN